MTVKDLRPNDYATVSIADEAVKVSIESGEYLVKWYKLDGGEFIGEFYLSSGTWGAYPTSDLEEWKIEFIDPESQGIVTTHYHLLNGSKVLLFPTFKNEYGKPDLESLYSYASKISELGGKTYCFFENSYNHDLESRGIIPLRFNQNIDDPDLQFSFIVNKEF
jgi:hypothetical protein